MTKSRPMIRASIVMAALAAMSAGIGHAEEKIEPTADNGTSTVEQRIADSLEKLVFVPHDTGAPTMTDTGGVRAVTVGPKLLPMAPEQIARTLSPSPSLYWYLSKGTTAPVRFTLYEDEPDASRPILKLAFGPLDDAGIYDVNLADHGIELEPGHRYTWSVALSTKDAGSAGDGSAHAVLEHESGPSIEAALQGLPPEERAIRLAHDGYWYDALTEISDQVGKDPHSPWRALRAELLSQAGLHDAARFDQVN